MSSKMIDRIFLGVAMVVGYTLAIISDDKSINILYFGLGVFIALLVGYFTDEGMRS